MMKMRLFLVVLAAVVFGAQTVPAQETAGRFPFGQSMAGGQDLLRPFGLGVSVFHQTQEYDLSKLEVNLPGFPVPPKEEIGVDNRVTEFHVQLDLWLLPFLNVFGLLGHVDGETDVQLEPAMENLLVKYNGTVYGGGFTAAAGTERFFGAFTTTYTDTSLNTSDSSVTTWVFTPKAGVVFETDSIVKHYFIWGGAMFQMVDEKHQGLMDIPGLGAVDYNVELKEKDPANFLLGLGLDLGHRWQVDLEGGFGKRKHVLFDLIYRFTL